MRYLVAKGWHFPAGDRGGVVLRSDGSRPVYWARASDPSLVVHCSGQNGPCQQHLFPIRIHVPAGAQPQSGSDGHMVVVDQQHGYEYDFWQAGAPHRGTMWVASGCRLRLGPDLGTGLHGCAEAALIGLQAGLLRASELSAGVINHALVASVPCTRARSYVWPANGPNGSDCPWGDPGPPLGTLFRLNMSDRAIAATHAPGWQRAIMTAVARYGMYVVDTNGGGNTIEFAGEDDLSYTSFGFPGRMSRFVRSAGGGYYAPNHVWIVQGRPFNVARLQVVDPCVPRRRCR